MTLTQRLSEISNYQIRLWQVVVAVMVILVGANYLERMVETRPRVEVKDLIREVKAELVAADEAAIKGREAALFKLRDFEMEIQFVVRRSGDFRAEVVGVGGGAGASSESVQKLKLHWDAVPPRTDVVPAAKDGIQKSPTCTIGPEAEGESAKGDACEK